MLNGVGVLVSVIIPFYNRFHLVCRAIDSVLNQSYQNYEIILINDGSIDDIAPIIEIIGNLNNVRLFQQENKGPSSARNLGIDESQGEYIAFLDSDDLWDSEKLMLQIDFMKNNNYLFSHTSYYRQDLVLNKKNTIKSGESSYKYPFVAFHCRIATPTVVIHKSLFVAGNRFDESISVGEDTVLWVELSKKNILYGLPYILSTVNIDENNTANNHKLKINALKSINKSLTSSLLLMLVHKLYINIRIVFRVF